MDHEDLQQEVTIEASIDSSSEILNDPEEPAARESNREAYDTVSSIDDEIPSLEARGAKEWIIRSRAGSLPQEQVPPEIIGHIFKFCVHNDASMVYIPLNPYTQGLTLSHVCSHWRRVALVERSLWNTVFIDDPSGIRPDALEIILSRAGNGIIFRLTMVHIPPPILRVIRQYADKFQSVKLRFDYEREVEQLDVPFSHLGALRKLRLELEEDAGEPTTFEVHHALAAFANPSCLRQLVAFELDAPTVSVDLGTAPSLLLPWSQLERLLICCDMPIAKLVKILSQCARLVSCEITLFPEGYRDTDSITPLHSTTFTLPNLSSLTLQHIDGVLDSIVAPSLRVLKIYDTITKFNTLFNFVQRSKCNLQTLHVSLPSIRAIGIEQLLLAISGVLDLRFLGPHVMNETILDSIAMGALLQNVEILECCVSSCRAVRNLVSNRCESDPNGVKRVMRKFTAQVPMEDVTDEWQEFHASLQSNGAVYIHFEQPHFW